MTESISSESADTMAKLLLESFNTPLQTISAELEKLEYENTIFLLTYITFSLFIPSNLCSLLLSIL